MKTPNICGIYAITHRSSGGVYIGSSKNISGRWRLHISRLSGGRHHAKKLLALWLRDGSTAFTFSVLEECHIEDLVLREQAWLDSFGDLLNSSLSARACPTLDPIIAARGGRSRMGHPVSESTRATIGARQTAHLAAHPRSYSLETRSRISESMKRVYAEGRHSRVVTVEQRAQMSAARIGKVHHSPEVRLRISAGTRMALARPEVRAKLGDARRASWITRKHEEI